MVVYYVCVKENMHTDKVVELITEDIEEMKKKAYELALKYKKTPVEVFVEFTDDRVSGSNGYYHPAIGHEVNMCD